MLPIRDHNPSEKLAFVTWGLIALNIAIYLWGLAAIQTQNDQWQLYYSYAMIPARISNGEAYHTLVTSVFLHGGFMHLAGNMLFLFIFGDNLEEQLGHVGFALFYLASGVGAALAQYVVEPWSPVPLIGASGAIAGVMGAYLLFFPKARVDVLIWIIFFVRILPVPAWIMLGLWFALQVIYGLAVDTSAGGVAYWAHSGGFAIGLALVLPVWLWQGGPAFWRRTGGHPPHPDADAAPALPSRIPVVRRKR